MRDRLTFVDPVADVAPPPPLVDEVHERVDVSPGKKYFCVDIFYKKDLGNRTSQMGKNVLLRAIHTSQVPYWQLPIINTGNNVALS